MFASSHIELNLAWSMWGGLWVCFYLALTLVADTITIVVGIYETAGDRSRSIRETASDPRCCEVVTLICAAIVAFYFGVLSIAYNAKK